MELFIHDTCDTLPFKFRSNNERNDPRNAIADMTIAF